LPPGGKASWKRHWLIPVPDRKGEQVFSGLPVQHHKRSKLAVKEGGKTTPASTPGGEEEMWGPKILAEREEKRKSHIKKKGSPMRRTERGFLPCFTERGGGL